MRKARFIAAIALLAVGSKVAALGAVQSSVVRLEPARQLKRGVDAWPLIANPGNEAERRINRHLVDLNARLEMMLQGCEADSKAAVDDHQKSGNPEEGEEMNYWHRHVDVTMAGPAWLSLVSFTDAYCGGAHPFGYTEVAAFNLKTGEPADPTNWFEVSAKAKPDTSSEVNVGLEQSILAPTIQQPYRALTHHDCDTTYADRQPFLVWPDADAGKVYIQADRLPGCCQSCGIPVAISLVRARKLGFTKSFLQSIEESHALNPLR